MNNRLDILTSLSGIKITNTSDWERFRRPELMKKLRHAGGGFGFESDDMEDLSFPDLLAQAAAASGVKNMEAVTDQNFADFLEL